MTSATSADVELLAAVAREDEAALEMLHARHAPALFRFIHRLVDNAVDAEDIVLATFYDVWRNASRFEARSSVRTWLFGIARHKALDVLRARDRLELVDDDQAVADVVDPEPTPLERLLARQESHRLSDCVDALPELQREAFWLHVVDGLKLREIASLLGVPENTVATRVHHSKHRLRDCLSGAGTRRA